MTAAPAKVWRCRGERDGWCMSVHRRREQAEACCRQFDRGQQALYSRRTDRVPVRVDATMDPFAPRKEA